MYFSVIIPTLNSAKHISSAIKSAISQKAEVIVVDSYSTDGTDKIAKEEGATVLQIKGTRLKARIEGAKIASAEYIINLDSDMILVEGILQKIPKAEAIALGEITIGNGITAKLMKIDRKIIQEKYQENLKIEGGVIPRVYRRDILLEAYRKIPERLLSLQAFEDSLIYYLSGVKDVKFVKDAVYHIEDDPLPNFLKKWYKYGKNAKLLKGTEFEFLVKRGRPGTSAKEKIELLPIMLAKGIPFALGYYL
ncbi:glycosyltransferase family 2 protein [Sulfolobus tengchongensis]|uniref:Glycosyltransferase family 2 protein n=1 Tax=Sulfolobus tengchongensis TaxID=207809 RepID=A0AAX4KX47_9CREN